MTRKRSARLLLLGGLTLALGCRSAPPRPALPIAVESDVLLSASPDPNRPATRSERPADRSRPARAGRSRRHRPSRSCRCRRRPSRRTRSRRPRRWWRKRGRSLPPVIPPPAKWPSIPPAMKPTAETPPVIAPIPADGVKIPAQTCSCPGRSSPTAPFELSIIGPPKDTSAAGHDLPAPGRAEVRARRGLQVGRRRPGPAPEGRLLDDPLRRLRRGRPLGRQGAAPGRREAEGLPERRRGAARGRTARPDQRRRAAGAFPPYRVTGAKLVEKGR